MSEREIPAWGSDSETKNKILMKSTELFALKGYNSVGMKEIAKAIGIKAASIYYYYEGKDALLEDILKNFESIYKEYFVWQSSVNEKAESLEELMENMFNKEFLEVLNPMACLGMCLAFKEQHNNESARRCVFKLFYEDSIRMIQADFDGLVKKGIIPPSDTKTLATIFMFCVIIGNDIRMHEYTGTTTPIDCLEMYSGLRKLLTAALTQGNAGVSELPKE